MWIPYINVIKEKAPNAFLVFDKFHIVHYLMEAADQVRRNEIEEKGKEHKQLQKKYSICLVEKSLEPNRYAKG